MIGPLTSSSTRYSIAIVDRDDEIGSGVDHQDTRVIIPIISIVNIVNMASTQSRDCGLQAANGKVAMIMAI